MSWSGIVDLFRRDFTFTIRSLGRSPVFVLVATLSVAFGLAGAIGSFSVLNAILFRPKPHVGEPERLAVVFSQDSRGELGPLSYPDFLDISEQAPALAETAVVSHTTVTAEIGGQKDLNFTGELVSESYFSVLGTGMALGRGFSREDVADGGTVVVLGHHVWRRDLGGDPGAIGRVIHLDGLPHTVVGVAPPGFESLRSPEQPDIWVLVGDEWRRSRGTAALKLIGRLRPGANLALLQSQLAVVANRLASEHGKYWQDPWGQPQRLAAMTLEAARVPPNLRAQLYGVIALVALLVTLVLLVACSNVANLLLVRASARQRELAVRQALGAGRRHLFLQMLSESLVLAALAGSVALVTVSVLAHLVTQDYGPLEFPVIVDLSIDWRIVAFALGGTIVVALLFGLAPALKAVRGDLVRALKVDEASHSGRPSRLRVALVVAQVAGSLALVLTTALLLRGLQRAVDADIGCEPRGVVVIGVDPVARGYDRPAAQRFYEELMQRLRAVSGVEAVAQARTLPLGPIGIRVGMFEPEGYTVAPGEVTIAGFNAVSPGYFGLLRVGVLRGREFRETDTESAPLVAIVNRAFADRYWPGEEPVGKRIIDDSKMIEVVGLVDNGQYRDLTAEPEPHFWVPASQHYERGAQVLVRVSGDPHPLFETLREQVHALDSDLPVSQMALLETVTARATEPHRLASAAVGAAGGLTLGLAMLGVYGVVAFDLGRRRRELGVRIALGASAPRLVGMVVRRTLGLSAVGLAIGLAIGLAATFALSRTLYGVEPFDLLPILGAVALLVLACLAACLPVALRAAAIDPVRSLRTE